MIFLGYSIKEFDLTSFGTVTYNYCRGSNTYCIVDIFQGGKSSLVQTVAQNTEKLHVSKCFPPEFRAPLSNLCSGTLPP